MIKFLSILSVLSLLVSPVYAADKCNSVEHANKILSDTGLQQYGVRPVFLVYKGDDVEWLIAALSTAKVMGDNILIIKDADRADAILEKDSSIGFIEFSKKGCFLGIAVLKQEDLANLLSFINSKDKK